METNLKNVGAYFVELNIGTPPQNFVLDVDTGSSYLVLVGKNCEDVDTGTTCASANPGYNHIASSTSQIMKCGSIKGCSCRNSTVDCSVFVEV